MSVNKESEGGEGGVVEMVSAGGTRSQQPYHVLVVATGVQYGDPIKGDATERENRLQGNYNSHYRLFLGFPGFLGKILGFSWIS